MHITFYGRRDFVDMIKSSGSLKRRLSWIFWVGLKCNHKYPFKKETKGELIMEEEKAVCAHQQRLGDVVINQWMPVATRSQRSQRIDPCLASPGGSTSANVFIVAL